MNEREVESWSGGDRELLRAALSPTAECLSLDQLEALAAGRETPSARAHAERCARCQAELALLQTFEKAPSLPDEHQAAAWIAARLDSNREGLLARLQTRVDAIFVRLAPTPALRLATAVALLGLVASGLVWQWHSSRQPELRASVPSQALIYRAVNLHAVAPAGDVPSAAVTFKWEPVPGAADYEVKVMEVDHNVLWTSKSTMPELPAPKSLQQHITAGKMLLWEVTAMNASGAAIAESDVVQFRLVGGASSTR